LLISVADHDTGSLTLGKLLPEDDEREMAWFPEVVNRVTTTHEVMLNEIKQTGDIRGVILKYSNVNINDEELLFINKSITDDKFPKNSIGIGIHREALINFASPTHSGVDVNVYATGPSIGTTSLKHNMENVDIFNAIFDFLEFKDVGNKTALNYK